jgi:RNA-directed DNA polymerase
MFIRQVRYVKRMHPNKPAKWTTKKYWGRLHLDKNDNWVFGERKTGRHLLKFAWFNIERHILVKGSNSPDDPALRVYWQKRTEKEVANLAPSWQKIAKHQDHRCPICGQSLYNDETLHQHHIQAKRDGGRETYNNYLLLHLYCHQKVTARQNATR